MFLQNNMQIRNLVLHERSKFSRGIICFVSGNCSRSSWLDCIWLALSSSLEGTVAIKNTANIMLIEPKIRNGGLNPPTLYNHAPIGGPANHLKRNKKERYHENVLNFEYKG